MCRIHFSSSSLCDDAWLVKKQREGERGMIQRETTEYEAETEPIIVSNVA